MLLAMRQSSRHFEATSCLKSPTAVRLLRRRRELDQQLEAIQTTLDKRFYALFEAHYDQSELRKALLRLKRDVQQARPLHHASLTVVANLDLPELKDYARLLLLRNDLFKDGQDTVIEETAQAIEALQGDVLFQQAIGYAAPALARKLKQFNRHNSKRITDKFSRSLYAYAAKWVSKSNPLNYFAGLSFPKSSATAITGEGNQVEFQIDLAYLLALEQFLLKTSPSNTSYGISLSPYEMVEADRMLVLLGATQSIRLITLVDNPILSQIRTYFRDHAVNTFGNLVDHLYHTTGVEITQLHGYLDLLLKEGILKYFLIDDFLDVAGSLKTRLPEAESLYGPLGHFHCQSFPVGNHKLPAVSARLDSKVLEQVQTKYPVHLNLYFPMLQQPIPKESVARIVANLQRLKPILTCYGAFSHQSQVLSRCIRPLFESGRASYMACLVHLTQNQSDLQALQKQLADHHPLEELSQLEGTFSEASLSHWTQIVGSETNRSLNCTGVYAADSGDYHLNNLWDGEGHYLGRYRARECPRQIRTQPDDYHEVQIYDMVGSNKNLVNPVSTYGFSLDRRYQHLFEQFLEPCDILLETRDGSICYRHAKTQKPIRFFWRGFILNAGLPLPYQLLLINSPDAFYNPFAYREPPEQGRFRKGLRYESIVLRRDFWAFRLGELPQRESGEDLLHYTYRFGCYLHQETQVDGDYFYYRIPDQENGFKPYFLDITNCQSVAYLANMIGKQSDQAYLILEKMEPSLDALSKDQGKPHMSEVLLEV